MFCKPEDDKELRCKWIHYKNPYLKLGPFKLEEKNLVPFVGIFRDFMSDNHMKSFIDKAKGSGHLKRSSHSGKNQIGDDTRGAQSYKRTSKQIWLSEFIATLEDVEDGTLTIPAHVPDALKASFYMSEIRPRSI